MKTLHVSVIQITCTDGLVEKNLSHAFELASEACKKGAELVLFPEFMSLGYRLTEEIWDSAEPFEGPTINWLRETSRQQNIYVGSSFLEANNGHFFNTFAMADPSGDIVGTVRKREGCSNWDSPVPNNMFGSPKNFRFSGRSAIIDGDGTLIAQLYDKESIGAGRVSLNPGLRKHGIIPRHSRYVCPGPVGREIIRLMEFQGYLSYTFNRQRKRKARSIGITDSEIKYI